MRNQVLLCGALLLLLSAWVQAQELKVESFARLERDLLARTSQRLDLNDVPCAVLRVSVANAKSFTFAGNIIGNVVYSPGEAIVYLTDRTQRIKINSDKFGLLEYEFPERLSKNVTYRLTLKLFTPEARKTRTLIMPVVGIGEATSYGIMLGIVRKWGGYVKVKYNFSDQSTDLSCDDKGFVTGTQDQLWFTGEKKSSRFAVTGGLLFRMAMPLYLYAGAGYGYKKLAWETFDQNEYTYYFPWAEASEHSYTGVESELGLIWRIKNFAISGGVQNTRLKYWEGTFGIALMF